MTDSTRFESRDDADDTVDRNSQRRTVASETNQEMGGMENNASMRPCGENVRKCETRKLRPKK